MGIETALLIGSLAVGTYSAIQAGNAQEDQMNAAANQAQADADAAASASQVEAQNIRKAVQRQRASARAALSDSGVNVDVGTAELIQSDIEKEGEQDALTTIFTGQNTKRRLNSEATGLGIAAGNAGNAGYLNATSSALSAGVTYAGWKTKKAA